MTWDSDLWSPYVETSENYNWNNSFFNLSYSYSSDSKIYFIVEWIFTFANADDTTSEEYIWCDDEYSFTSTRTAIVDWLFPNGAWTSASGSGACSSGRKTLTTPGDYDGEVGKFYKDFTQNGDNCDWDISYIESEFHDNVDTSLVPEFVNVSVNYAIFLCDGYPCDIQSIAQLCTSCDDDLCTNNTVSGPDTTDSSDSDSDSDSDSESDSDNGIMVEIHTVFLSALAFMCVIISY